MNNFGGNIIMRKNIMALFASIILLSLALVACGNNDAEKDTNSTDSSSSDSIEWPHDKTTFILPFDAGGSVDTMIRSLASYLEDELGTQFTIFICSETM